MTWAVSSDCWRPRGASHGFLTSFARASEDGSSTPRLRLRVVRGVASDLVVAASP